MRHCTRVTLIAACALLATANLPSPALAQQSLKPGSLTGAKDGLSINKSGAFQGYSLVAPMNSKSSYLIDMEGRIVNEWKSDYTPAMMPYLLENGHLLRPANDGSQGFAPGAGGRIQEFTWEGELVWDYSFAGSRVRPHHDICRLPNGNVLVVATDPRTREEAIAAGRRPESVGNQLQADCILEIKPTGKTTGDIVWQWYAWDHLVQDTDKAKPSYGDVSEHPELIDINFVTEMMDRMLRDPQRLAQLRSLGYVGGGSPPPDGDKGAKGSTPKGPDGGRSGPGAPGGPGGPGPLGGDWMHVNSVAYSAELDQIMISVHEFSEVWIIDHGTTTAEAKSHSGGKRGKGGDLLYRWGNPKAYRNGSNADQRLFAQHCAHWIAPGLPGAGNMLVFNNGTGRPDGAYSSIDEIVLPLRKDGTYERDEFVAFGPEKAQWSYTAADKTSFYSMLISGAQRLPNGNTYICSGNQGILFEVTPKGEILWQYKHPGAGMEFPRPGELFPSFVRQMLRVTDEQKESIDTLQAEVDAKVAKLLTKEQREQFARPPVFGFGGPPGAPPGGPGRPGGPPGGPAGFRPPRPGEVIPAGVIDSLKLTEAQAKGREELQKHVDAEIAKILTPEQKSQIEQMQRPFAGGPGFGIPGFGPPGFGGPGFGPPRPPRPGELFPEFLRQMLQFTDEQKKSLDKVQGDVDAKLAKLMTDQQRKKLEQPPAPPGPGGPGGFRPPRPGEVLPATVAESLELTKDQTEELAALQKQVDADVAKVLTDPQKSRIKELQNPPAGGPGFGPPGLGGPGGGPGGPRGPGGPGGPGGGPGGPGGFFRSYRYAANYAGLVGKTLTPGKKLEEVARPQRPPSEEKKP